MPDDVAPADCDEALSRCTAIGACADGLCPANLQPEQAEAWLEYCDWHVFCECDAQAGLDGGGAAGTSGTDVGSAGTSATYTSDGGPPDAAGADAGSPTGDDPHRCSAICHKSIDCGDDDFDSAEECVQMCRALGESGATAACPDALRASNECGTALDCDGFLEFSMQGPGEDYPCKAEYEALLAACR